MKLSIIVGVHNQFEVAGEAIARLMHMTSRKDVEIIVIDNGSREVFPEIPGVRVVRNEANTGNYPLFFQALELAQGELLAFLHSDVFVLEHGWDERVVQQFDARPELGLLGFIGSTEIDAWGGRGLGTTSNMKAIEWNGRTWSSEAHVHGAVGEGMTVDGSVVDGCVMVFRKSVLAEIPFREDFPLHHFYDRLFSCEVIERGYRVGILGVAFAHLNGQTANQEQGWQNASAAWFKLHYGIDLPHEWAEIHKAWVMHANQPSRGKVPDQWDYCSYLEAERIFLQEFRDQKHLVPMRFGKRL